jgi:hypothetical protein
MSKVEKVSILRELDAAIRRVENAANILRAASDLIALDDDYELAAIRIKAANAALSSAIGKITQVLNEIGAGGKNE